MPIDTAQWLSAKRLRAHGLILGLALWSVYLWTIATPGLRDRNGNLKGTDFLHFYTLSVLANAHRGTDLYDINAQARLAWQHVPDAAGIRYLPLYPPQVSIFLSPLARLPYGWALALWWTASTLIYAACCYSVWRACPNLRQHGAVVAILAAAFPGFFHLIAWGQTSAMALAFLTLTFFFLRSRRDFLAGLALGCLIFKPQLGLAAAIVFVSTGAWRVVAGAFLAAVVQLSIGVLYYGMEPLRQWFRVLSNLKVVLPLLEPRPYQTHCLRTFWSMLLPWGSLASAAYLITAVVVLSLTVISWRAKAPLPLKYSALLLATVLISPHLTVYDLVILAPAILLLADWFASRSDMGLARHGGILLYLIYALPLLGPLARWTRVQLSVIAMAALLYLVCRIAAVNRPVVPADNA